MTPPTHAIVQSATGRQQWRVTEIGPRECVLKRGSNVARFRVLDGSHRTRPDMRIVPGSLQQIRKVAARKRCGWKGNDE